MEVYILRHAVAVKRTEAAYPDDDRPLTEDGIKKMELAAKGMARVVPALDAIYTSRLSRAAGTARIAARAMWCEGIIETCTELMPGAPAKGVLSLLARNRMKKRVLIVGHETGLGLFASALIGSHTHVIEFKKGALCRIDIACLPLETPGRVIWHLSPKHLRLLGKGR
ncbi:MAG: hypothetical protein A2052_04120 [Deltaproteobacteria bacterium GWA2_54_12]|nr:MAG: hypothetical protein A2052_04120 [Deltaproteobacteria bacterium GWA2_54_12]